MNIEQGKEYSFNEIKGFAKANKLTIFEDNKIAKGYIWNSKYRVEAIIKDDYRQVLFDVCILDRDTGKNVINEEVLRESGGFIVISLVKE